MLCFRAELFDYGVHKGHTRGSWSHLCCLVYMVLTPCLCFASSVCFDAFKNLILINPRFSIFDSGFPGKLTRLRVPYTFFVTREWAFLLYVKRE